MLITGAAMGMGRLYAERAVAEGAAAVILWDRDAASLSKTAATLTERSNGVTQIAPYVVDIADLGAIAQTAQRVRTEVGNPDILSTTPASCAAPSSGSTTTATTPAPPCR